MSVVPESWRRGGTELRDGHRLYWWVEIAAVLLFYVLYSAIRNANEGGTAEAEANALRIIEWQRSLGIYWEEAIQNRVLDTRWLVIAANYFYGSLHFVVTLGAAVFCFRRFPDDYPRLRNTLAFTTGLALIGFVLFPLMPPRLLPESFGFVDTLERYPTFWSFNSGAMSEVSNQYAAMPSVHVAWALWCAVVFVPRVRSTWLRAAAIAYPALTVAVIVVTGNHYLLDAVGGALVLAAGWVLARWLTRAGRSTPDSGSTLGDAASEPDERQRAVTRASG